MSLNGHLELAGKLRRLRIEAGLSTREVARATGFSQSKISKIENGKTIPLLVDVMRLLEEFDVREEVRDSLVEATRRVRSGRLSKQRYVDADSSDVRLLETCHELEMDAKEVFVVRNDVVPLQLQTSDYLRYIYSLRKWKISFGEFAEFKLKRQAMSYGTRRTSYCLIDENLLYRPVLPSKQWLEQLNSIKRRVRFAGLELGVLPALAALPAPVDYWVVNGRDVAFFENTRRPVTTFESDRLIISQLREDFEALSAAALWGSEAILLIDEAIDRFARNAESMEPTAVISLRSSFFNESNSLQDQKEPTT